MTQIERIAHYEALLDQVTEANDRLKEALELFAETEPLARELDAYYTGSGWRQDYEDDEAGRLPAGLKRGVLSQDAVYNALTDRQQLRELLRQGAQSLASGGTDDCPRKN